MRPILPERAPSSRLTRREHCTCRLRCCRSRGRIGATACMAVGGLRWSQCRASCSVNIASGCRVHDCGRSWRQNSDGSNGSPMSCVWTRKLPVTTPRSGAGGGLGAAGFLEDFEADMHGSQSESLRSRGDAWLLRADGYELLARAEVEGSFGQGGGGHAGFA